VLPAVGSAVVIWYLLRADVRSLLLGPSVATDGSTSVDEGVSQATAATLEAPPVAR
jgi:hypothetical protein